MEFDATVPTGLPARRGRPRPAFGTISPHRGGRKEPLDPAQLKQVPLFTNLTPEHLRLVAGLAASKELKAGEHIFREGEIGAEMYVIAQGKVRISKMVPGIGEESLAILEPGNYFGEMALVDDTPRSADASAHSNCTLYAIQKADL